MHGEKTPTAVRERARVWACAIARSIAEAHGGSLSLESSDANGSAFVAILPAKPGTAEE